MFCKWCGKTIKITDERCPACGRETPALSDCGGLYDLKHPVSAPALMPSGVTKCPFAGKAELHHGKDRLAAKKHHTGMLVCFAVMIIVVLILLILCIRLDIKISKLEEKIDLLNGTSVTQNSEPKETEEQPVTTGDGEAIPSTGEADSTDATVLTEPITPTQTSDAVDSADGADDVQATEQLEAEDNVVQ